MDSKPGTPGARVSVFFNYCCHAVDILSDADQGFTSSVFLIAATNTFIRFVHFEFGSHYGEYIDAASEHLQRTLADDEDKDTFVHMHSTKWFNLQSPEGRKSALCHILALVKWHERSDSLHANSEDGSDSMEDDSA